MAYKHTDECFTLGVIREAQIKTMTGFHSVSVGMAKNGTVMTPRVNARCECQGTLGTRGVWVSSKFPYFLLSFPVSLKCLPRSL